MPSVFQGAVPVKSSSALFIILAPFLSAISGLSSVANASAPSVRETELIGSAQFVAEQDNTLDLLHGYIAVAGGTVHEPKGQKGVAMLLSRLLVADDLRTWLEGRGGSIKSSVDLDAIRFEFTCAPGDLEETVSRLNLAFKNSEYDTARVAAARTALVGQLEVELNLVGNLADQAADQILYGRFAEYTRFPNLEHVAALTATDLQAFHKANLGANRVVFSVVSSLTQDKARAAVESGLAGLGDVGPVPADPNRPLYSIPVAKIYIVDVPDADHVELRLLSPGLTRNGKPQPYLDSWKWVVNGGPESRLQNEVVDAGLATSVECGFDSDWNRMGAFRGSISSTFEDVGEALHAYMTVVQDQRNGLLTRPMVEEGRARQAEWEAAQLKDPSVRAYRQAQVALHNYPENYFEVHSSLIQTVRARHVIQALRRHMYSRGVIMIAAGPAEKITENLQYYTDTFDYTLTTPASEPEAVAQVDRLLEAMGGRELWVNLKGAEVTTEIEVEQNGTWQTRTSHLWRYFDRAEQRVEQNYLREFTAVIDGTPGWVEGSLGVQNLSNGTYRELALDTRRWLYSVLHHLAVEDSVIVARLDETGRLALSDRIGDLCWIELAENGRPKRSGFFDGHAEQLTIYNTWSKSGDYLYSNEFLVPYSDHSTDAEYPGRILTFVPNPPLLPSLFERPAGE